MKFLIIFLIITSNLSQVKIYCFRNKSFNEIYDTEIKPQISNIIKKKNIILSIIQKYSLGQIMPFFESLIKANFENCDVVMFVRKVSPNLINYLKSINVIVYEISEKYKNIRKPTHLRWKMFIDYLNKYKDKYRLIFSVDVRDTFFQKNVFRYYENYSEFLGIAIEDGTLDDNFSKRNIINLIGAGNHRVIHNERIICMGTLWGSINKFLEFANILWEKLKLYNFPRSDQGLANCLFYHEHLFKDFVVKSDNFGPVMTIGLTKRENILLDFEDNILNFKGEIASVIHQYDRKNDIRIKIIRRFSSKLSSKIKSIYNHKNISNNDFNKRIKIDKISKDNYENITFFKIFFGAFAITVIIKLLNNKGVKKIKYYFFGKQK